MSATNAALAGAAFAALYAGHYVGDYWMQTDHQAKHKGEHGPAGRIACAAHVLTYTATQAVFLAITALVLDIDFGPGAVPALAVSAVTHYLADRREHGIMLRLARLLPGKDNFIRLGAPRANKTVLALDALDWNAKAEIPLDNPQLATGAWALDWAWHIFFGAFVAALIIGGMA